ncbi:hypothetical protein [Myceligenerans halotolerans]
MAVVAGYVLIGIGLVLLEPGELSALADLTWAGWAVAVCTSAGVIWSYGARRWAELPADVRDVRRAAKSWPALLLGTASLVMAGWIVFDLIGSRNWVGPALTLVAYCGMVPAVGVVDAVRRSPPDGAAPAGTQLARLIDSRRIVRGVLAGAGAQVALITIALGAHLNRTDPADGWDLRVLATGLAGTVAVAVVIAPTTAALNQRARELADCLYPIEGLDQAADIAEALGRRKGLDQATGDLGIVGELERAVVILTPLIAGATSAWIGS